MQSITETITAHSAVTSLLAAGADTTSKGDQPTPKWMVYAIAAGVLALLWSFLRGGRGSGDRALARAMRGGRPGILGQLVGGLFKALWQVLRWVLRVLGGRELWGQPRSDASIFRPGTRPAPGTTSMPVAQLGSVALAPARVSLVKKPTPKPQEWALKAGRFIADYQGRWARGLDVASAVTVWTWRLLRAICTATWPVLRGIGRALAVWHRWPYAARSLARIVGLTVVAGLYLPAWRGWTILALVLAAGALVAIGFLWKPKEPGDDAVYGPRIWAVLRDDLKLPEEEPRENWLLLPPSLAAPDARIIVRLPWTFRGSDLEKEQLGALLNSRLPGEWVGRYSFIGEHFTATYTHKPPPKPPEPAPEPPEKVDLFGERVQEAIDAAQDKPETYVFGIDENDEIVEIPLVGEQAHIAVSVGTGGGKSALLQMLATQVIRRRGTILAVDPKMVSLRLLKGVEGVYLYDDPGQGGDMRRALEWAAEVVEARFYEYLDGKRKNFPPLFVYMEESNELTGILKAVWMKIKDSNEPNADPIWESVASILRKGRQVNVHVVAVFQDLKDTDFSGVSLGLLFPVKIMGAYAKKQWDRIVGSNVAMPPSERKAGRLVGVKNGVAFRFQSPYAIVDDPELSKDERAEKAEQQIRQHCLKLRDRHKWDSAGLYAAPPAPSPRHVPALLSRDTAPSGPIGASEGGLSDETAGRVSHEGGNVTASDGDVTASRDRLRLIPGQGGRDGQEAEQDPTAPPDLLPLAEVARRLQGTPGVPKYDTMRQHKNGRRDDFPKGTGEPGKELYTVTQIRAYYEQQEKKA